MDRAPRKVGELMTPAPYSFAPDVSISDATGRLLREGHSGAPVVSADGHLVGVVSELDLIQALAVVERGELPKGTVEEAMTPAPITVTKATSVYDLARFFQTNSIRRAPVVEEGRLVGLVSRHDVLRALSQIAHECSNRMANRQEFTP